ncbi:metal ABC transporter substrate-binding protein [Teredinibacter sp. KSP-S5-2]|uniref:metal ABC transporter substrate-binding protein n=1 Tax=Teredinibacter sp. KSP-S5-2 TaxID=3034506 RepID=UPI002934D4BD|nr:metal ABC transporter substrate-binding protein [Teredinibacter sp. KSP-S5-2]WNO09217.1 metal ABC transporter substrate-binding protein [Teredinibacter sp. KSP-S5-2]
MHILLKFGLTFWIALQIVFLTADATAEEQGGIKVLASIRPLALLAKDIGQEMVEVESLLPASASPHHYSLKVSDKRKLQNADLVVWVGPQMEGFMESLVRNKPHLPMNLDGEVSHNHSHHHDELLHLWLSLPDVIFFAEKLTKELIILRPEFEASLVTNMAEVKAKFEAMDKRVLDGFGQLSSTKYIAYHDGFDGFVDHNKLEQMAALTDVPEERIGSKSLLKIKESGRNCLCLMAEEGEKEAAARYSKVLGLPLFLVDSLASSDKINTYSEFYWAVSKSFRACFESGKVE